MTQRVSFNYKGYTRCLNLIGGNDSVVAKILQLLTVGHNRRDYQRLSTPDSASRFKAYLAANDIYNLSDSTKVTVNNLTV